ncbi:MAG: DUF2070 family protein [Halobacteriales archaeon]
MTATQGNLAALSRYIFRAPNWYSSVGFALAIAAVVGVGAFDSQYILEDAYQGVFYVGIPTVVAGLLTTPVDRWLGGQLTFNRSSLLALACELIVVVFLTGAGIVAVLTPMGQDFVFDVLLAGLAFIFAFRLLVVMAISHPQSLIAWMPASIQTATAAVLLFVYSGTLRYLEVGGPLARAYLSRPEQAPGELLVILPQDFLLLAGMCVFYSAAVWGFVRVMDRPWRRSLGVSLLDFLQGFVGHIAEGTDELEAFFEEIGEEAVVPVTVLSFERHDGTEKARFVLPMIHPGPMGEIGGGNLPVRVAESTDGLAFPPHATAGHDFNLVTEREVDRLIEAAGRAADRIEHAEHAAESVRVEVGEASVLGQAFGGSGLLVGTFAPGCADDVEYGVGRSAIAEARSGGLEEILLVDAHNSNDGIEGDDLGHVTPGSRRSVDLIRAAGEAGERLAGREGTEPELGVAWDPTPWDAGEGIGPLGVRVATVRVGDQETAYVLIDGNNMEPGLRDRLIGAVEGVDDVEMMTTDSHLVTTVESVNQVGGAIPDEELRDLVADLVAAAREDYEPVAAGMATERTAVTVFGNDRTETLASHANAVISMGGALAGALVVAAMAISVLIFFLTAS